MKELLSPAGNIDCLKAAVQNGADAVYLGGKLFGARAFAGNFTKEELKEAVTYSHLYGVRVYVTVNTIIYENEVEDFLIYINYLYSIGVDALIMQDIGMISLVRRNFPDFELHASTQMHNHNNENIKLLKELKVKRLVLDRELSLEEINKLDNTLEKEVFIHGALCNSYSGCCLFSSLNGGRSGNRGECVQSCRMPFKLLKNNKYIETDNKYLLSTKELNTTNKIEELIKSNITSFKIEGRMKSPTYVGFVTRIYRKLIDSILNNTNYKITEEDEEILKVLFNREFTNGYLFKDKVMNIKSSNHQGLVIGEILSVTPKRIKIKLNKEIYQEDGIRFKNSNLGMIANMIYNEKGLLINKALPGDIIYLDNKINIKEKDMVIKTSSNYLEKQILNTSIRKVPIAIEVLQKENKLEITYIDDKNNIVKETIPVEASINRPTSKEEIEEKLTKLGNTPFTAKDIQININNNIFVNMKSLNEIRRILVDSLINIRTLIHRDIQKLNTKINYTEEKNYKYEISLLARTKSQVEASLSSNIDRIYVDEELYEEYKDNSNIYLRLPRVNTNYNYSSKNILVTELGGINKYNDQNYNVIGDYFLNIVNNHSIKYLLDHNVYRVTLSPEVDYNNLENLIKDKVELIVYGRIELMLTKSCPIKELKLCPCNKLDTYFLEDINHNKYPILHNNCLTHIMHYKNIDYLDNINYYKKIGIRSFRLELFDEDHDRVIELINKIRNED